MHRSLARSIRGAWVGLCVATILPLAGAAAVANDLPDPQQHLRGVMSNPNLQRTTGEFFAWHATHAAGSFLDAYEATQDPAWLAAAADYYDFYIGKLETDPDGYKGWIGDTVHRDPDIQGDALVGDAILLNPIVRFAELVKNDPALHERFGDKADAYIELAEHIGWEKWNHRGTYYVDNGLGSYHADDRYIDAEDSARWVDRPSFAISENLNKHYAMGTVFLRLYRITGEEKYRQRVEEIFSRNKQMWRYYPEGDRVSWNFWMPHGPHDVQGRTPRGWVAVHPNRPGYQATEVRHIVEVYDSGLVYDEADMRRLANTNRWMRQDDGWRSSDGATDAGTLWASLARFDSTIRDLYEERLRNGERGSDRIARAYLHHVTDKLGPERRYVDDPAQVRVFEHEPEPGRTLSMTEVIPGTIQLRRNGTAALATQTRGQGTLRIELLSADGEQVLGTLHEGTVNSDGPIFHLPRWDGTHPDTDEKQEGEYRVRWTLGDEQRHRSIRVIEGTPAEAGARQLVMQPGETITIDFEDELEDRWQLEGASVSDERAKDGSHSLRLGTRDRAVFRFGEHEALPVRITMAVYDAGHQQNGNGNGPAWGVRDAVGDIFVMRQAWRNYLNGNRHYAWVNTGENNWHSVHHVRISRSKGWREWVFDFTNPDAPAVTCDGERVDTLREAYTPAGAVAIHLMGGEGSMPAMYVDNIRIEYSR
ncbi:MAG: hypothetical protein WD534_10085 [Phycisphaeraceae bacterium]